MLQALYDYEDSSERTLDFKTNDEFFIYRDVADKKSWCLVINHAGDLGYVPYNYVKTVYVSFGYITNISILITIILNFLSGKRYSCFKVLRKMPVDCSTKT